MTREAGRTVEKKEEEARVKAKTAVSRYFCQLVFAGGSGPVVSPELLVTGLLCLRHRAVGGVGPVEASRRAPGGLGQPPWALGTKAEARGG